MRVAVANAPAGFSLGALPKGVTQKKSLERDLDSVMLFAVSIKELKTLWPKALASTNEQGAVWVAYPKKSSGIDSDLTGMEEWGVTKGSGWNPVAMIGIDETWSAVRFKHAPGLEETRHERQQQSIADTDGTVCVDRVKRVVTAPKDLQQLLAKNAKARAAFDALSFTNRKEFVVWILEAKKPETRATRVGKTLEMLAAGKKNPSDRGPASR